MDLNLRQLYRKYLGGDVGAGASLIAAIIRSSDIFEQIEAEITDYRGGGSYALDPVYIGFLGDFVRFVFLVSEQRGLSEPPKPQLMEHLDREAQYEYQESWQEYWDQDAGSISVEVLDFTCIFEARVWEHDNSYTIATFEFGPDVEITMAQIRNADASEAGSPRIEDPELYPILNVLGMDYTFDSPEFEEEPEIFDQCELFPFCGHKKGHCGRRWGWEGGRKAEIICVCGASIPPGSRFSICQDCLNAPDPDDPYGDPTGWEDYCREHGCSVEDCPECPRCGYNAHGCECDEDEDY
jgi:hypothetical protein